MQCPAPPTAPPTATRSVVFWKSATWSGSGRRASRTAERAQPERHVARGEGRVGPDVRPRAGGRPGYRELFLINSDPEERFDLSEVYPELTKALGAIIDRFPKGEPISRGRGRQGRRPQGGNRPQPPRQQRQP